MDACSFQDRSCCLPSGGPSGTTPSPPQGTSCPTNGWYWHTDNECCVPKAPQTPSSPAPQCEDDCIWSSANLHCKRQPGTTSSPQPAKTTPVSPSKSTSPATPSSSSDCGSGTFLSVFYYVFPRSAFSYLFTAGSPRRAVSPAAACPALLALLPARLAPLMDGTGTMTTSAVCPSLLRLPAARHPSVRRTAFGAVLTTTALPSRPLLLPSPLPPLSPLSLRPRLRPPPLLLLLRLLAAAVPLSSSTCLHLFAFEWMLMIVLPVASVTRASVSLTVATPTLLPLLTL